MIEEEGLGKAMERVLDPGRVEVKDSSTRDVRRVTLIESIKNTKKKSVVRDEKKKNLPKVVEAINLDWSYKKHAIFSSIQKSLE